MNLSYFKKSNYSKDETIKKLKDAIKEKNLDIISEVNLDKSKGILLIISNSEWADTIINSNKDLIGLIPISIAVIENQDTTINVGAINSEILTQLSHDEKISIIAEKSGELFKDIINKSTGFVQQKPTAVKLYSTTTCPYCVMEKQWLDQKQIKHEVVYVDKDQKAAENMVKETGQMGVPVTEIQYPDGEKDFIVRFDQVKLSHLLI